MAAERDEPILTLLPPGRLPVFDRSVEAVGRFQSGLRWVPRAQWRRGRVWPGRLEDVPSRKTHKDLWRLMEFMLREGRIFDLAPNTHTAPDVVANAGTRQVLADPENLPFPVVMSHLRVHYEGAGGAKMLLGLSTESYLRGHGVLGDLFTEHPENSFVTMTRFTEVGQSIEDGKADKFEAFLVACFDLKILPTEKQNESNLLYTKLGETGAFMVTSLGGDISVSRFSDTSAWADWDKVTRFNTCAMLVSLDLLCDPGLFPLEGAATTRGAPSGQGIGVGRKPRIPGSSERPIYTLLRPREIRQALGVSIAATAGEGEARTPHERRGHWASLRHERYARNQDGSVKRVWKRHTWVGPSDAVIDRRIYRVMLQERPTESKPQGEQHGGS